MQKFDAQKLQEKLKIWQSNLKHKKLTRKDIAILVTAALAVTTISCVSSFSPGGIVYSHHDDNKQKVSIGQFTKLAGPPQTFTISEKNPLKRKIQQKLNMSNDDAQDQQDVPTIPEGSFGAFHAPSFGNAFGSAFGGGSSSGSSSSFGASSANLDAYNHFKDLTDKMRSVLSDSFTLKSMSSAPSFGGRNRFTASFENADGSGNVLEKLELMSIARTDSLKDIKTAQNALDSLVEESNAVHVIESHDDYLIYEYAGNGGYQIGKISLDDKTINIFGYVNLTTSDMPDVLKTEWIHHFESDL